MLGNPTNSKTDTVKSKNQSKKSSLTWSLLGGTVVAVVGIVVYKFIA